MYQTTYRVRKKICENVEMFLEVSLLCDAKNLELNLKLTGSDSNPAVLLSFSIQTFRFLQELLLCPDLRQT